MCAHISRSFVFFFNDTATTEIYTLSLHDALPISHSELLGLWLQDMSLGGDSSAHNKGLCVVSESKDSSHAGTLTRAAPCSGSSDRKSTRLNSSHANISYAVFCLKKKTPSYHHSIP